mmetsp:Transcript_56811/g.164861  ORF Transcript_56811/g.164861 Transcript_56811/m.164861 type:complete len:226 (+) Transcript_56811:55-732(+)|eukprot:CAMPEP_0176057554 /NCGR_PEP_ID=MMETSP0120_2-20121206/28668_1 /TAXON_ID=160619 /ORGANISM="Kryptoperidinium foliaceum, Strain CCMP 1326" /LENGTH=225 /DNA_ID=CAMNT_0017391069 /DNA_START=56 /DNA_END=733 /DNA_ORIENTATION=-
MADVKEVVHAFKCWDTVGAGVITRQGLRGLIATLVSGITDEDIERLFEAAAEDGLSLDNVRYEEFLMWLWANEGTTADAAPNDQESDDIAGPWATELAGASSRAAERYPPEKVQGYFGEVTARLRSSAYREHVTGSLFDGVDADRDGRVSFAEAAPLVGKCLQCAADLAQTGHRPSADDVRAAFDAHDSEGRGFLGPGEFLGLMRHLQAKVAEAALAISRAVQEG